MYGIFTYAFAYIYHENQPHVDIQYMDGMVRKYVISFTSEVKHIPWQAPKRKVSNHHFSERIRVCVSGFYCVSSVLLSCFFCMVPDWNACWVYLTLFDINKWTSFQNQEDSFQGGTSNVCSIFQGGGTKKTGAVCRVSHPVVDVPRKI